MNDRMSRGHRQYRLCCSLMFIHVIFQLANLFSKLLKVALETVVLLLNLGWCRPTLWLLG